MSTIRRDTVLSDNGIDFKTFAYATIRYTINEFKVTVACLVKGTKI